MNLNEIVAEGFSTMADELDKTRDAVDNGNIPVIQALGEIKLMLSDLLAANSHLREDLETYQGATNVRLAKLERKTLANGAGHGAAE